MSKWFAMRMKNVCRTSCVHLGYCTASHCSSKNILVKFTVVCTELNNVLIAVKVHKRTEWIPNSYFQSIQCDCKIALLTHHVNGTQKPLVQGNESSEFLIWQKSLLFPDSNVFFSLLFPGISGRLQEWIRTAEASIKRTGTSSRQGNCYVRVFLLW